jgi:predicted HTH domain antitoxin
MQVTLEVPDVFAGALLPDGQDAARAALEAMAIEAYREHRLTGYQVRELLDMSSLDELDGFLKKHHVWLDYSIEDFEREAEASERLRRKRESEMAETAEAERLVG